MSTSDQYYDDALLSEVAYLRFDEIDDFDLNSSFSNESHMLLALTNEEKGGTLCLEQAYNFWENWEIVSYQGNTETGFAATLFKNKNTGKYHYACRGTEPGYLWDDAIVTDGGDIVLDGLAIKQIVDMYNDWQRINAAPNTVYKAAKLELLADKTDLLMAEQAAMPLGVTGPYELYLRTLDNVIIDSGKV